MQHKMPPLRIAVTVIALMLAVAAAAAAPLSDARVTGRQSSDISAILLQQKQRNRHQVTSPTAGRPGSVVRVYGDGQLDSSSTRTDNSGSSSSPGTGLIPYCSVSQAQLSYHGYKDAVKFFVAVSGLPLRSSGVQRFADSESSTVDTEEQDEDRNTMLVIAGGEGYMDFRRGVMEESATDAETLTSRTSTTPERNQLLAWQVFCTS